MPGVYSTKYQIDIKRVFKMTKLTSKERLLRAIRHEEVDRVPISPDCSDYLNGVKLESLSFRDSFDILLETVFSGVAEQKYTMLYGESSDE